MKRFLNEEGGVTFSVSLFVALLWGLMVLFAIIVSKNTVNLLLHEARSDLYLINRNAIFAIQRDLMGEDISSLYEEELEELIKEAMKNEWQLDNKLKNGDGVIKSAKLVEVEVLNEGEEDRVTDEIVDDLTVHTVVKIKFVPIIFNNLLKDTYEFNLHGDIKIKKMNL